MAYAQVSALAIGVRRIFTTVEAHHLSSFALFLLAKFREEISRSQQQHPSSFKAPVPRVFYRLVPRSPPTPYCNFTISTSEFFKIFWRVNHFSGPKLKEYTDETGNSLHILIVKGIIQPG